jgi:hypothetical protein
VKLSNIISVVWVLILLHFPVGLEAASYEVDGYRLGMLRITEQDRKVVMSGRIESGPSCERLRLDFFLTNEYGNAAHVICVVEDVGSGSRLISGRDNLFSSTLARWEVSAIYTKCLSEPAELERQRKQPELESEGSYPSLVESEEREADASLEQVDLVQCVGFMRDQTLEVGILYRNRYTDELVNWKNGKVACKCEVFELIGSLSDMEKGELIAEIQQPLNRSGQTVYIDIPDIFIGKDSWGIVDCIFDTGYRELRGSNPFQFR